MQIIKEMKLKENITHKIQLTSVFEVILKKGRFIT